MFQQNDEIEEKNPAKLLSNCLAFRICHYSRNRFQDQMLPNDADYLETCPPLKIGTGAVSEHC